VLQEVSARINASLILFPEIPRRRAALSGGLPADVVKSPRLSRKVSVMRNIMIFAALMVGAATWMAQTADKMTAAAPARVNTASARVADAVPAVPRSLSIPRDARGHFQAEGRIDGQRIDFMVDTGASVIALNERSAARFGLRPSRGDYNATVSTANGTIKAARTRLAMVELGGLIVRDVDAMVLPDEALSENLLGLSFLSKLKRFEYAGGRLVLEQ
jgi:aspartyl protease family protein